MHKSFLSYRIIIEKEKVGDKVNKYIYNAYCPVLGLNDFGNTIDQAIQRITELIQFHVESLIDLGYKVPIEKEPTTVITSVEISTPSNTKFSYV